MNEENLLSKEEIIQALKTERLNPDLKPPDVVGGVQERAAIYKILLFNNIIFITCDSDTGFIHITHRLNYSSLNAG